MEKEKITIIITYDDENKFGSSKRKIDVYGVGDNGKEELLFSETETATRSFGNTKSGVAGAVNLLYGLLFDHSNTYYYVNDEYRILNEMADKHKCRTSYNGEECKPICFDTKCGNDFTEKVEDSAHKSELSTAIKLLQYELNHYTDGCKNCGNYAHCQEKILPHPCSNKTTFFDHRNTLWGYLKAAARLFKVLLKSKKTFFSIIIREY